MPTTFDYPTADVSSRLRFGDELDAPSGETEGGGEADQPGIVDIHSGSPLTSLDGRPYQEW